MSSTASSLSPSAQVAGDQAVRMTARTAPFASTGSTGPAAPLVVTRDSGLRDEILRLCVKAAVSPEVVTDVEQVRRSWASASCVLVGADCAGDVSSLALTRRRDVILVSDPPDSAALWRAAVAVHADHVALVPDADGWLVDRLTDSIDGAIDATTVGVVGASGGAGASTLAAALGLTAARRGSCALLVDLDPLAGGLELAVGCESTPGLRWADVAATRGHVGSAALRSALPSTDGLAVLSWGASSVRSRRSDLDPLALAGVLTTGKRGCDVVVADLPRRPDDTMRGAVQAVDTLLMVCTADVGSASAGHRLLEHVESWCADIRLVVRRRRDDGLVADSVAAALELPLAAVLPTQRAVARAIDEGLGPLGRGSLERRCASLLDGLGIGDPRRAAPRQGAVR